MADKTTTTNSVQIMTKYADGDTRTISIDDPNMSIDLGQAVHSLGSFLLEKQVLIGDKTGAAFTGLDYANLIQKTKTEFDLG